jgi:tetratricopeptide (TPR) repeat protein
MALYLAYGARSQVAEIRGLWDAGMEPYERSIAHARRAGYVPPANVGQGAAARFFGRTPVAELLAWLDERESSAGRDQFVLAYRAGALAMQGDFVQARGILAQMRTELAERGGGILLANITAFESVDVELLAGDPAAAVEFAAEGFRQHEELGELTFLSAAAASLAKATYALDGLDEADAWAGRAGELGAIETTNEMSWRQVKAKVLARRGEHAEAERLAREAVAMGEGTESINAQGDANADLAEVLVLGGKPDGAVEALEAAAERYERKGNLVSARSARARLAELQDQAAR